MYILFNKDGSIFDTNISEYVMQGSNLVNVIYVAFVDSEYLDWSASGNFTLPDDSNSVLVGVSTTFLYKGVNYIGWKITLTNNETKYDGTLNVSINLIKNEQTLYTYLFNITINPTGYPLDGEWTTNINYAQFNTLMAQIATKFGIGTTALVVNELPLQGSENIIYYLDRNGYYEQYMFNGSEYVLLGTTIFKSDIPTINVSNSGTLSEGDYQTLEENYTINIIRANNECLLHKTKTALDSTSLYFAGVSTTKDIEQTFICLKVLANRNYTLTIKQLVDLDSEQTLENKTIQNSNITNTIFNGGTINGSDINNANLNNANLNNATSRGIFKVSNGSIVFGETSDTNQTYIYQDSFGVKNNKDIMYFKAGVLDFSKNGGEFGHYLFNGIPNQSVYVAYSPSNGNTNIDSAFLEVWNNINSAKDDISDLQNLVNTINSTYASKTWVQEQGYGLQSDIDEINSELNTINGSITTIESDIDSLQTKTNGLAGEVNAISSEIDTINTSIASIESDVETLESNLNSLTTKVSANTNNISTNTSDIESINGEITTIKQNITNTQQAVLKLNNQVETNTDNITTLTSDLEQANSDITQTKQQIVLIQNSLNLLSQQLDNKVSKTSNAGAYINSGDTITNVPVSNTPTANAIPQYGSDGILKSAATLNYPALDADAVINKEIYQNSLNLEFNNVGIKNIDLSDLGGSFTLDMFFGTTPGEEKTIELSTPTVSETIITQLQTLLSSQKIISLQGEYSQSPDTNGTARVVIINSNLQEGIFGAVHGLLPPFYCTGVIPNKNYPYGLQFSMYINFNIDTTGPIAIKTKVFEPNSGGNVEIPTITISSLSGTLSDSDYEKLVNSDMAKLKSPYGTFSAFKYTVPNQQNNLYYYAYLTDEINTICYSIVITNGTTKTYYVETYNVGDFTPETITINMTSKTAGTISYNDFLKIKLGVPICIDYYESGSSTADNISTIPFSVYTSGLSSLFQLLNYETGEQIIIAGTTGSGSDGTVQIIRLYPSVLRENLFNEVQTFYKGLKAGNSNQLTINDQGALSITDSNGTVGLNGQGIMYRTGGSTNILKMPTDNVSNNSEIASKAYIDSQDYLKATNTTGALLTISNDNYIQLRSNIINGGYFVVGNETNSLPGFEVRDNSGDLVFDAKSKQGVVDIGTSTARMLFGSGALPDSKVVKFYSGSNILTFGLGSERLTADYNGRVLFQVQTTTVSKDFNQVQQGEFAGILSTGITDGNIIINSIYDTTNQVSFMQPFFDGTEWRAHAICTAQSISATSNVEIKYIKLP